jgi:hypothetical protein
MSNQNLNSGNQTTMSEADFATQLGQLTKKWQTATEHDLEIRHDTGVLFNLRFGNPDIRQNRGGEVLKKAAEQLQISQSDISRMRGFAFSFKTIQDLKEKHPGVTTWRAVKDLLPKLTPKGKAKEQEQNGAAISSMPTGVKIRKLNKITQQLEELPSKVREVLMDLTGFEEVRLKAKFQAAVQALLECLDLEVSELVSEEEETLPSARGELPVKEGISKQAVGHAVEEESPLLVG